MKQIKEAIPLDHITGVSMSPGKDSWVVVKMKAPVRDLVLDLGIHGVERHSEFVTVLHARVKELLKQELKVTFEETIAYNNSRKPKSAGVDMSLKFAKNPKPPKDGLCVFKAKGNEGTVLLPS